VTGGGCIPLENTEWRGVRWSRLRISGLGFVSEERRLLRESVSGGVTDLVVRSGCCLGGMVCRK
jgi:hypothetical protein